MLLKLAVVGMLMMGMAACSKDEYREVGYFDSPYAAFLYMGIFEGEKALYATRFGANVPGSLSFSFILFHSLSFSFFLFLSLSFSFFPFLSLFSHSYLLSFSLHPPSPFFFLSLIVFLILAGGIDFVPNISSKLGDVFSIKPETVVNDIVWPNEVS